jgi:hypothetical protein
MALVNRSLVFSAIDQNNNWLLYTYGTHSGILKSYDLGYKPKNLRAHNDKVYFVSSWELYATDGSDAPSMLAHLGAFPERTDYAVIDDLLYVSISPYTASIWRTDGTECGTMEISTGVDSPFPIEPSGNNMIMGGASNLAGNEPHIYRNITEIFSPCSTPAMATSASAVEESVMTPYPNPFTSDFTLRVNGNDDEVAEVGVYTFQGLPVDKFEGVKTNTEYPNIGSGWPKGIYLVKINKGGKLTSHTIIKK